MQLRLARACTLPVPTSKRWHHGVTGVCHRTWPALASWSYRCVPPHLASAGIMELGVCVTAPGQPVGILPYLTASHLSAPLACRWLKSGQPKETIQPDLG